MTNDEFIKPPLSWHDRIRQQDGQPVGNGCFVTNACELVDSGFTFSILSIPGKEPQFRLNPGIYVVTNAPLEDLATDRFTEHHLYQIGIYLHLILTFPDKGPSTTAPLPEELGERYNLPRNTDIDLGNNMTLNCIDNTINGGIIYEVAQVSVSDAKGALQESLGIEPTDPSLTAFPT